MKSLWDYYDGEPFMENPPLGILGVNPKRRKRGKKMAVRRRRRVHRRGRRRAAPRRRRYGSAMRKATGRRSGYNPRRRRRSRRRNPWAMPGMVVAANPRRRRRGRKGGVRRRRSHRRHRNPALLGFALPGLKSVAFGAVGFVGPSFISGLLSSAVPSVMAQISSLGTIGKYVTKAGSILGLAWLTRKFVGAAEANMVLIGGGINVGITLIQDFMPSLLPANPLSMYIPTAAGMRAYVPNTGTMRGLGVNVPPRIPGGAVAIPSAAAYRSYSRFGIANRLMRY